ncbi:MAG: SH3 domain-containing protein [Verrucomicrobiota bacterium]
MKSCVFALFVASCLSVAAQSSEGFKVRVTGDRVSLRANPDINSELLERAMQGEELVFLGQTNGWVAVQAPESLDFWVSGQYVVNGVVQPTKLNIRSGPSQNYSVVCVVNKGDSISLRGEFNDWLKIAPPAGSLVWISEDYVEIIEPPKPEPEPEPVPEPEPAIEESEPESEPKPVVESEPKESKEELKPLVLVLDKTRKQGVYDEIPGVLRRANPGLYKLVLIVGDIEEPICLVRGKKAQMEAYLNRSMLIKGKKYWAKDVDLPVLQPTKIHLDPILKD